MTEILVVLAIIAIALAIAIPNYLKSSTTSKKTVCINNLKQIDAAIDQWAIGNNASSGTQPTEDVYNYVKAGKPRCPSGGTYTLYPVDSIPQVRCSREEEGHILLE